MFVGNYLGDASSDAYTYIRSLPWDAPNVANSVAQLYSMAIAHDWTAAEMGNPLGFTAAQVINFFAQYGYGWTDPGSSSGAAWGGSAVVAAPVSTPAPTAAPVATPAPVSSGASWGGSTVTTSPTDSTIAPVSKPVAVTSTTDASAYVDPAVSTSGSSAPTLVNQTTVTNPASNTSNKSGIVLALIAIGALFGLS